MRIISGLYKSRKIVAPKNLPVRPTTDMAKESLFNIINNLYYFDDISVLDLFAGTGNISYEFASRGTEQITCVDQDFGCIKFINKTAEAFGMPIQTIKSDVFKFLEKATIQANIIFADPPYNFELEQFSKIPEFVFKNNLLLEDGVLIVEHSKHTNLSSLENFAYSKSYGGNVFSFFEKG
ncbi:16S rRNA (guanine(966)-N(2))-methyltransferase RsmD [Algibacter amylolyticus]|uniref:16S rRNA (Guanine(966)-N(2))-methyltransferase RsmD n=1 Tax=Algibacter amylolyticus TaxID=1608400 RepID=A0A5M7AXY4_9FLAO|nr:16S rRNA (guanine(966)-N(2))-methyltransferase RsmD [Algibacter amylolyticus]KAA5821480.1 16S rRNA (guanine(966)-N(2))-methyltransferase RsmD [Algibacter amylolyticus]MBB5268357.1 16S rRNA (guanine(966)-N(2))-methyltransferase RsmD [Algibacter amylolyticus]TSJ72992.1 16S rRNA (guanine(966)-N(2))-methyltransferase RsmD [Algibacter amylolyticus]